MPKRDRVTIDPVEIRKTASEIEILFDRYIFFVGLFDGACGLKIAQEDRTYLDGWNIGNRCKFEADRGRKIAAQVGDARRKGGDKKRGKA